ncbi:putative abhydrolase domain-containing protein [Phytophthora ramorum]|uniref:Serine aminopeptidase S33 domain-containing protein n=1 Tax=Phytophthora ramorum TaxID=164328 RepID=H3GP80_PHYRM|nr:putative abhydrolase domain-containing protein [Phytophthora ramorum]
MTTTKGPIGLPLRRVQSRNALAMSAIQEEPTAVEAVPLAIPVVITSQSNSCSTSPTTSSSSSESGSPNQPQATRPSPVPAPSAKATAQPSARTTKPRSARSRSVAKFEEVEATSTTTTTTSQTFTARVQRAFSARALPTTFFGNTPATDAPKSANAKARSVRTRSTPCFDESTSKPTVPASQSPPKKAVQAQSARAGPITCFDDSLLDEAAAKAKAQKPSTTTAKTAKSLRSRPVPCFDDLLSSGPAPQTSKEGWKPRVVGTRPASTPSSRMPRSKSTTTLAHETSSSPSSSSDEQPTEGKRIPPRRRGSNPSPTKRKMARPKPSTNLASGSSKPAKQSRSRRQFPAQTDSRGRASSDEGQARDELDEDLRPRASSDPSSAKKAKTSSRPRHFEGKFQNRRGQSHLYFSLFPPEKMALRGIVLYLHGMGDHCRRNTYLYERFCKEGFGVITYDLLNHGASDYDKYNTRAHISNFNDFVDDTNDFVAFAKTNIYKVALRYWRKHLHPHHPHGREKKQGSAPQLPLIIAGTSFGSLIGLHTVLSGKHKFHAAVWASPSIGVTWTPVLWAQWKMARPLVAAFPTAKVIPAIQHNLRSRNPAFLKKFQEDPLTSSDMITPRSGHESLSAMMRLQRDSRVSDAESSFSSIPMLFLAGSDDRISDQQATMKFFDGMGSMDKEFKLFDGLFHMIYEEPEKEDVIKHLVAWLHKRFPLETRHPNNSHMNVLKKFEPSLQEYKYHVKAERTEL